MDTIKRIVFLVEDKMRYRREAKQSLEDAGYTVVEAGTLQEALEKVGQLDSLGIEVAVLDGNLTPGDNSGRDGYEIATAIRVKNPKIKVIIWSQNPNYTWGDEFVHKEFLGQNEMNDMLEKVAAMLPSLPAAAPEEAIPSERQLSLF